MLKPIATLGLLAVLCAAQVSAQEALRVRMTEAMLAAGFDKHLLTRFKFKHRIALEPVTPDGAAELALLPGGDDGRRVFSTLDGQSVRLRILSDAPEVAEAAETFRGWLTSGPGKAAVESFAVDGRAFFTTQVQQVAVEAAVEVDGDIAQGSDLAIRHCGRCHVVDQRNRMGGIGSTPSCAALRGRDNWSDLFLSYWTKNPHPSITQVAGLTEPFSAERPAHIHAVELTMTEVEAITAFVGELVPLDLGPPIQ